MQTSTRDGVVQVIPGLSVAAVGRWTHTEACWSQQKSERPWSRSRLKCELCSGGRGHGHEKMHHVELAGPFACSSLIVFRITQRPGICSSIATAKAGPSPTWPRFWLRRPPAIALRSTCWKFFAVVIAWVFRSRAGQTLPLRSDRSAGHGVLPAGSYGRTSERPSVLAGGVRNRAHWDSPGWNRGTGRKRRNRRVWSQLGVRPVAPRLVVQLAERTCRLSPRWDGLRCNVARADKEPACGARGRRIPTREAAMAAFEVLKGNLAAPGRQYRGSARAWG